MSGDDLAPLLAGWPVGAVSSGITDPGATLGQSGDVDTVFPIASVTKLWVGMVALVALEESSVDLDSAAGPTGSTVRHLLAHASGLAFKEDRTIAAPGRRRIYSNVGIVRFAEHLAAQTGMPFEEYLRLGVLEPLGMSDTELRGSPAGGGWSTVSDLMVFCRELLRPTLVSEETVANATRPHFPDLAGVLPGVGRFAPNPWGLSFEIKGSKHPHWTGTRNSPATFGHFGGSGTFLWVDSPHRLAAVTLTDRKFGPWALEAWPRFSDALVQRYGSG